MIIALSIVDYIFGVGKWAMKFLITKTGTELTKQPGYKVDNKVNFLIDIG